jgi:hypothetical protein
MEKIIHNTENQEISIVPLTAEEIAIIEKKQTEAQKMQVVKEAEVEARATQKAALLDRLGITEDEARLLLG